MNIKSKKELRNTIREDIKHNRDFSGKRMWIEYLKGNLHSYTIYKYIIYLRKLEYWQGRRDSIIGKIGYAFAKHKLEKYQLKTQIFIHPGVFDTGLCIQHPGYIWIGPTSRIGKNCTVLPRVLIGKKKPGLNPPCVFIGDNCYISTGVTILGPVKIGNNVTIAAGSVVTHDIPDNCLVAGVPAKIIKENCKPIW